jgi:Flp pilus assembly pilin Flp
MRRVIARFVADTHGSAAIEYSIIVACIALGILGALISLGGALQEMYAGILAGLASLSQL